ncbi:cysteine synthase A [Neomoorella thermoacetica]|uniref:cysteine synthase A n=1 Tax=Neomoorella thermoacetica TaxID=1525 RepID=UPI0008FB487B|nr:cysteine synthase A [Moorella thermoacetica]OIQ54689.1 O-acetylserine sulfhydrylase [Moorella thermoacetica]
MRIAKSVEELVGKTPLVQLNRLVKESWGRVLVKLESLNPGGSIKDRICISMIDRAEREGVIKPGYSTLIEPTGGNTGIGLAMVGAARGYRVILTMPESMSVERRQLFQAYGAEVVLTPAEEMIPGAVRKAEELAREIPGAWIPNQFANEANPRVHAETTAMEIWEDTGGTVDIVVGGMGTGGTVVGVARGLKRLRAGIKVVGVEPASCPVFSGGKPARHKIQGIGPGFIPAVFDRDAIDEIITVTDEDAYATSRNLAREEGLLVGISSGAVAFAALQISKRPEARGKLIVAILPDTGERYLSTDLFAS